MLGDNTQSTITRLGLAEGIVIALFASWDAGEEGYASENENSSCSAAIAPLRPTAAFDPSALPQRWVHG